MPGMLTQAQASGGGQSVFANPAFYGNVKMLTDSTMNQFQNQRYRVPIAEIDFSFHLPSQLI